MLGQLNSKLEGKSAQDFCACQFSMKIRPKWHMFAPLISLFLPVFILLPCSKIVDRIDSDADGYITTAELKAWIKRVQKRYVYENVAKVWTDYDLNKDNKISWDEYKQATYGYYLGMLFFLGMLCHFQ